MKEELHNLDILDASFPCSVFSIAGDRQKAWGKEKVFREGQKAQRLDDLAFYSIDLAKELKPKVSPIRPPNACRLWFVWRV